jgi:hypothetical protein
VLYISHEHWSIGTDINKLPGELENSIPRISLGTVFCDNSRPETISYMQKNGIPAARPADKWNGSVDDGVMFLRSFTKIVVHSRCTHVHDEMRRYSFKTDRLTGVPLPELLDRDNHCIDSLRYALSSFIRNTASTGYFSRAGLLDNNEPVEIPEVSTEVYATLVQTAQPGAAVAWMVFATSPTDAPRRVIVCDWEICEAEVAHNTDWLNNMNLRLLELSRQYHTTRSTPQIFTDKDDFGVGMGELSVDLFHEARPGTPPAYILMIDPRDKELCAWTTDERASLVRSEVIAGKVKISRYAFEKQVAHRNMITNHFLSQIFSYKPKAPENAAQELVAAFGLGIAISSARERR